MRDGEPCSHRGCLSHISHPCEGCGRIGGKTKITLDDDYQWLYDALDLNNEQRLDLLDTNNCPYCKTEMKENLFGDNYVFYREWYCDKCLRHLYVL